MNELLAKAPKCPADVKWHFIGHLQSNKAARLVQVPNLYMVESVDSLKLAQKLDQACKKAGRTEKLNVRQHSATTYPFHLKLSDTCSAITRKRHFNVT